MPVRSFEPLNTSTDITNTRTFLHEVLPITGTIISGTYNEENIKNFTHGQFQSVYDYPYLSSSANHIFDITMGYSTGSVWATGEPIPNGDNAQNTKKLNIYIFFFGRYKLWRFYNNFIF